ncbi:MAG TPA: MBL fold metallo-hydrolase [Chthoniobacterales bacterium]|nr:MBL fold metallo-hydrolase [Chthoniobacterales bacterium]
MRSRRGHLVKFINLTRATEIGANSYYLESGPQRIVLDCGMHPKKEGDASLPNLDLLEGRPLDAIIVSHAHQDHIGTLPVLMRRHPGARVFMSEPTAEIGSALLHNSVNVMTRQREELGATTFPLFTHREATRAAAAWRHCRFRQQVHIGRKEGGGDGISFEMFDAGHVLGSAGLLLRMEGRTLFYSGDVNFDDQTIAQAARFPESGVDVLIMECTRGDHGLPPEFTRAAEERRLAETIDRTFARGGCVLVPVFALGKTQEALAMFYKFRRAGLLRDCPIYIGGLSAKMTEIYDRFALTSRRQLPRLQLLEEMAPFILNGQTIHDAPPRAGRIYALSSGMMTPKTLSHTFARPILHNPKHAICFVGYTDPESPAGVLKAAAPGELVALAPEPAQELRCGIEQFQFSAHASRESIVAYVEKLAPRKIVLVHGDPSAVEWMRATIAAALPGSEVIIPPPGVEIEL